MLDRTARELVRNHYTDIRDKHGTRRRLFHAYELDVPPRSVLLMSFVHDVSYVVLHGRRITPKSSSGIVKVRLDGFQYLAGDVVRLLLHNQLGYAPQVFAQIAWMIPAQINELDGANDPWLA